MPQKRTSGQEKARADKEEKLLAAQGHYSREQKPHLARALRPEQDEFARQGHYSREQRPPR